LFRGKTETSRTEVKRDRGSDLEGLVVLDKGRPKRGGKSERRKKKNLQGTKRSKESSGRGTAKSCWENLKKGLLSGESNESNPNNRQKEERQANRPRL